MPSARSGPLVILFGEHCVPRPCTVKRNGHNGGAPSGCAAHSHEGGRGSRGDLVTWISLLSDPLPCLPGPGQPPDPAADHLTYLIFEQESSLFLC